VVVGWVGWLVVDGCGCMWCGVVWCPACMQVGGCGGCGHALRPVPFGNEAERGGCDCLYILTPRGLSYVGLCCVVFEVVVCRVYLGIPGVDIRWYEWPATRSQ
jgi:hypothetical protein